MSVDPEVAGSSPVILAAAAKSVLRIRCNGGLTGLDRYGKDSAGSGSVPFSFGENPTFVTELFRADVFW